MRKSFFLLSAVLLLPLCTLCPSWSAFSLEPDEIEFRQALKDMSNDLRLLCVAAHPDDEDGATLAYYRYKYGVKTYALICTRGEGGQNEIGPELYEDLAVIRTKEMMEAAKIEGAELHFLDMPDFGFSKSIEETFEKWGKDVLLEKMVRKIREIRPHVIITHHGRLKDHGHHQAVGWAVQEAFEKAGDSGYAPDAGEPWQVQRLYIRDFTGESKDAVVIDLNEKDELRGKSYAEIAADALRAHKSQGMEQFIEMLLGGEVKAHYDLVMSGAAAQASSAPPQLFGPLFEGLYRDFAEGLDHPYTPAPPDSDIVPYLRGYRKYVSNGAPNNLEVGKDTLASALVLAGIEASAHVKDQVLTPGQETELVLEYRDTNGVQAELIQFSYPARIARVFCSGDGCRGESFDILSPEKPEFKYTTNIKMDADVRPTLPAREHLREEPRSFDFNLRALDSQNMPVFTTTVPFTCEFAPDVMTDIDRPNNLVILSTPLAFPVTVHLTNYSPGARTEQLEMKLPYGWSSEPATATLQFEAENEQKAVTFNVTPYSPDASKQAEAQESTVVNGVKLTVKRQTAPTLAPGTYRLALKSEDPSFNVEAEATVADIALPEKRRIGIVDSYDKTLLDVVAQFSMETKALTAEFKDVEGCDVIIIDMRAYAKRPDLREHNAELLDWCKRGGTLIVMYHKTQDWDPSLAPYPITLSNNRVTREDAPVKMLVPDHPWFNYPNKIVPEDWDGWRQERGLYFPSQWDPAYTPLIDVQDPGENIPPGSCLIAKYGEGTYFYTSLVWYRQLGELHPGALKLFANMLAL